MLTQTEVNAIVLELATPIESHPQFKIAQRILAKFEATGDQSTYAGYRQIMNNLEGGRAYRAGLLAAHYAQLAA